MNHEEDWSFEEELHDELEEHGTQPEDYEDPVMYMQKLKENTLRRMEAEGY